jgi:protocatechuate 3,4-dioxygenase beta subunit
VWGTARGDVLPNSPPAQTEIPAQAKQPPKPTDDRKVTVTGKVRNTDGQPVAGAAVALVTQTWERLEGLYETRQMQEVHVLGNTRTDDKGDYHFDLSDKTRHQYEKTYVVASGTGHGLSWRRLGAGGNWQQTDVSLPAEQVVQGRLLNLEGQAVVGARIRVQYVSRNP